MKTRITKTLALLVVFSVFVVCQMMSAMATESPEKAVCDVNGKNVVTVKVANPSFYCRHDDSWLAVAKDAAKGSIGALLGAIVTLVATSIIKRKEIAGNRRESMRVALMSAIAYFDAYIGDVDTGIGIIKGKREGKNGKKMPVSSWDRYELTDKMIVAALNAVKERPNNQGFPASEFIRHAKNYFSNVCANVDGIDLSESADRCHDCASLDTCLDVAQNIKAMLDHILNSMKAKLAEIEH